tara:strand:+ start:1083 stop:1439 length:357 start_codon:yes stop_codon:yes gene_type:complete
MSKLPTNTIRIDMTIDQDAQVIDVEMDCSFSSTMPVEMRVFYTDVMHGLMSKARTELDSFAKEGYYLREIGALRGILDGDDDEDDFELGFEPDEELLDKITEKKNGSKVISFNNKKLH